MGHVADATPTGRVDHAAPMVQAVVQQEEEEDDNHHGDKDPQDGDDGDPVEPAKQSILHAPVRAHHGWARRLVHPPKE